LTKKIINQETGEFNFLNITDLHYYSFSNVHNKFIDLEDPSVTELEKNFSYSVDFEFSVWKNYLSILYLLVKVLYLLGSIGQVNIIKNNLMNFR
jgi:hypothetical protein